jgi:hypothetical protein
MPTILDAQVLNGDEQFPVVNQIRWDMSRDAIIKVCAANNLSTSENDTMLTFDAKFFGAEAKSVVRFKNRAQQPWGINVKFKELTEKLLESLVDHFTRTTGESPLKAEKEKNLLLITMRMEITAWKTKTEKITIMVGRRNKAIFDINLSITPILR